MTYQKPCNAKRSGFIIADAILAMALSTMLVSVTSYSSLNARDMFDRAQTKKTLLGAYKTHGSEFSALLPHESVERSYAVTSSSVPIKISASAKWYGNDRIETDIDVSDGIRSLDFAAVRSYPFSNISDSAGMPLCSVDFGKDISISPITLPVSASLPLTDLIVRNGIAYISTDSSVAADPDLIIADIHDGKHPTILSALNTGPGIAAIALAGYYIYAAASSGAAQLHVVRLNSLSSLFLAKKYQLPLPEASTSPPFGTSIFYDKGKVYIGTEKWDGQEFSVVDVSVPENPAKISGFETGSKVNTIYVRNGTAYVGASGQEQLYRLNVTGQTAVPISVFSPSGWQRQEGEIVSAFEDSQAFGRTSGGFNIKTDKELFGWNSSSTESNADIPGGVYGLIMSRDRIYAATRNLDKELSVFDLSLAASSTAYYSLPVAPKAMACDGDRLYILAGTAPVIYEVTTHE